MKLKRLNFLESRPEKRRLSCNRLLERRGGAGGTGSIEAVRVCAGLVPVGCEAFDEGLGGDGGRRRAERGITERSTQCENAPYDPQREDPTGMSESGCLEPGGREDSCPDHVRDDQCNSGAHPDVSVERAFLARAAHLHCHVKNLLRKLNLKSRIEAAVWALEHQDNNTD